MDFFDTRHASRCPPFVFSFHLSFPSCFDAMFDSRVRTQIRRQFQETSSTALGFFVVRLRIWALLTRRRCLCGRGCGDGGTAQLGDWCTSMCFSDSDNKWVRVTGVRARPMLSSDSGGCGTCRIRWRAKYSLMQQVEVNHFHRSPLGADCSLLVNGVVLMVGKLRSRRGSCCDDFFFVHHRKSAPTAYLQCM